jgi:hypothetical protein
MSSVERATVVANHKAKAEEGVPLHKKIAERIKAVKKSMLQANRKSTVKNLDDFKSSKGAAKTLQYFWDYNTVEAVLLACSILICLAGVMFESDRFEDNPDGTRSKHAWQRDIVTYSTILLVFASLIYYGTVFLSETGVLQVACLIRLFADKKKAIHRQRERQNANIEAGEIELSTNPMMRADDSEAVKEVNFQLQEMAEAASMLKTQLAREKRGNAKHRVNKRKNKRTATKTKKKGFAVAGVSKFDTNTAVSEIELPAMNGTGALPLTGKLYEQFRSRPTHRKTPSYIKHATETGAAYYEDENGETSWDTPPADAEIVDYKEDENGDTSGDTPSADAEIVDVESKQVETNKKKSKTKKKGRGGTKKQLEHQDTGSTDDMDVFSTEQKDDGIEPLPEGWVEHDDGNGRKYFAHRKSGQSKWERPSSIVEEIHNPLVN